MANILTLNGSPSPDSRTGGLLARVAERLAREGHHVEKIDVRDRPAEDLINARAGAPGLAGALASVERAHAVVVGTPIYKAAYTGVLKYRCAQDLLDLLPQFAFSQKAPADAPGSRSGRAAKSSLAICAMNPGSGAPFIAADRAFHSLAVSASTGAVGAGMTGQSRSRVVMVPPDLHILEHAQSVFRQYGCRAVKRDQVRRDRLAVDAHEAHRQPRALLAGEPWLKQPDDTLALLSDPQEQDVGRSSILV